MSFRGPLTKPLPNVVDLDERRQVSNIARHLQALESDLAYLAGAVEPNSLAGSVVGLMGLSAQEIREQLRPLREALKDGAA